MALIWDTFVDYGVIECTKTLIMVHALISVALYTLALLFGDKLKSLPLIRSSRRMLLITAHPDDECMFFSPLLINSITRSDHPSGVHVLCLTNGNYYGQGKVREKEIIQSCQILGIPADHVSVINNSVLSSGILQPHHMAFISVLSSGILQPHHMAFISRLPDDPNTLWDPSALESQLFAAVNRIQPHQLTNIAIDHSIWRSAVSKEVQNFEERCLNQLDSKHQIVTFDDYGVSGHANHITISRAVRKIFQDGNSFKGVESVYYLESVGLWRKYLGMLDVPFTFLSSSYVSLLSPANIFRAQRAMLAHFSQLEWFRILYIVLSRYMLVNSFHVEQRIAGWPVDR